MNSEDVQAHIDAAGPDGRLVVKFVDRMTPVLDDKGQAVQDQQGNTVHEETEQGHVRTVAARVVKMIETHLGLGHERGGPIEHLIHFADILRIEPDPAEATVQEAAGDGVAKTGIEVPLGEEGVLAAEPADATPGEPVPVDLSSSSSTAATVTPE
jgi:hypothetical protein